MAREQGRGRGTMNNAHGAGDGVKKGKGYWGQWHLSTILALFWQLIKVFI